MRMPVVRNDEGSRVVRVRACEPARAERLAYCFVVNTSGRKVFYLCIVFMHVVVDAEVAGMADVLTIDSGIEVVATGIDGAHHTDGTRKEVSVRNRSVT